jgi:hypothetical protein
MISTPDRSRGPSANQSFNTIGAACRSYRPQGLPAQITFLLGDP